MSMGQRVKIPHKPQMKEEDLVITESMWFKDSYLCIETVSSQHKLTGS